MNYRNTFPRGSAAIVMLAPPAPSYRQGPATVLFDRIEVKRPARFGKANPGS